MKRSLYPLATVLAFALAAAGMTAVPAVAAGPAGSCSKLTGSASFNPGLKFAAANQTLTAKGTVTGCTPAAGTGGSGTLAATIKIAGGSCTKLANGKQKLAGTGSTTWKNKKVSKYALTFTTGTGNNITVATIAGRVSSGLFAGKKVSGQVSFATVGSTNCTTKPIKNITFKNTKPFVIS